MKFLNCFLVLSKPSIQVWTTESMKELTDYGCHCGTTWEMKNIEFHEKNQGMSFRLDVDQAIV